MRDEGRKTTLNYKNTYVFLFFSKELKLLWYVKRTDGGRQDKLQYWPITSSDHSMLCYFQDPIWLFFCFSTGVTQSERLNRELWGWCPQRGALSDCKLVLSLALTDSNWPNWQAGICIYYFITLTTSVTASAYLHKCISDWRFSQGSTCNRYFKSSFWRHDEFLKNKEKY